MSEVISFRLNKDNPREARALRVLKKGYEEGHNSRYIITEALLRLEDFENNELKYVVLVELIDKLSHVSQIFEQIGYDRSTQLIAFNPSTSDTILSDTLITSVKEAAKPRIKLE